MYCVFVKKDDSLKTKQIFCMKCVKNCMKENKDDFGEFCKQTSKQANKQLEWLSPISPKQFRVKLSKFI